MSLRSLSLSVCVYIYIYIHIHTRTHMQEDTHIDVECQNWPIRPTARVPWRLRVELRSFGTSLTCLSGSLETLGHSQIPNFLSPPPFPIDPPSLSKTPDLGPPELKDKSPYRLQKESTKNKDFIRKLPTAGEASVLGMDTAISSRHLSFQGLMGPFGSGNNCGRGHRCVCVCARVRMRALLFPG